MKRNIYQLKTPKFIDITGDYGFNQMDLMVENRRYHADRACGIAGLAGLLAYDQDRKRLSRHEATGMMQRILKLMPPMPWGIVRIGRMNRALKNLDPSRYLKVYRGPYHREQIIDYLIFQMKRDKPVLMLNTFHPIRNLKFHWITITGLIIEESQIKIQISSWGRRYTYQYEDLFHPRAGYRLMATLEKR